MRWDAHTAFPKARAGVPVGTLGWGGARRGAAIGWDSHVPAPADPAAEDAGWRLPPRKPLGGAAHVAGRAELPGRVPHAARAERRRASPAGCLRGDSAAAPPVTLGGSSAGAAPGRLLTRMAVAAAGAPAPDTPSSFLCGFQLCSVGVLI